jgi:hypothetical protein
MKRYRIFLEGLTREKVDGTNIFVSVHPSKVMIKNLKLDDKWRKAIVERKKELELPKKEKKVAKPAMKAKEEEAVVQKKTVKKAPKATAKKTGKKSVSAEKKKTKPIEREKKPKTVKKTKAKPKASSKTKGGT